jgi:PAS domain S-box-containing protein
MDSNSKIPNPNSKIIRILLIEDNPGDADLIEAMLLRANVQFELECVQRLAAGIARLITANFDVILLDLGLPDSQGLGSLGKLNEIGPKAPVIVLTGLADEEIGARAVMEGAQDYLIKGQVDHNLLSRAIRHAIERAKLESEREQYFKFFQTSADLMCIADSSGTFIKTNPAFTETLGYTEAELAAKPFLEFVHPDDKQATLEEMASQLRRGFTLNFENRYVRKDGSLRWLSWRAIHKKEEGTTYATARDITEQKRLEEAIDIQAKQFETFFDNSITPLAFLDRDFNFIRVNQAYASAGKRAVSEFPGHNHFEFYPSDAEVIFAEVVRTGKAFQTFARPFIYPDHPERGTTYWDWTLMPILDNQGQVEFLAFSLVDVTEQKKAAQERETLLRRKEGINLLQRSLLVPATQEQKLKSITDAIVRFFDADFCRIWLIRPGDLCEHCIHAGGRAEPHLCRDPARCLHLLASSGRYTHTDGKVHRRVPFGCYKIGQIAAGEEPKLLTNDVVNDPHVHNHEWAGELGLVSFAGYQLRVPDGQTIGVMALFAKHPISADEDSMLEGLSSTVAMVVQQTTAEAALKSSEAFIKDILASVDEAFVVVDREYRILTANRAYCEQIGEALANVIGRHCYEISHQATEPCRSTEYVCGCKHTFATGEPSVTLHIHTDVHGRPRQVEVKTYPMKDESGQVVSVIEVINDITEKSVLEGQLRQSQKMEAIGTLAGGIAHDFNNILTAILGFGEIVMEQLPEGSQLREDQAHVVAAGKRARDLVKQILTFSRRSEQELRPLLIQFVVKEALKLLRASIPASIEIREDIDVNCGAVLADPGQIHQVVMNLCTNGYQAMRESGGVLAVSLKSVAVPAEATKLTGNLHPCPHLCLEVADTGSGMSRAVRERIFEPYFTTKGKGEGTGLGLSLVHGIVVGLGGGVSVSSEPGRGTTFKVYLPLIAAEISGAVEEESEALPGGNESIMVVDDEEIITDLERKILTGLGYRVTVCADGEQALLAFRDQPAGFDLILTDMTMPKLNGNELAREILRVRPGLPIILCTGFSDLIDAKKAKELGIREFLQKPVERGELAKAVRRALDGAAIEDT